VTGICSFFLVPRLRGVKPFVQAECGSVCKKSQAHCRFGREHVLSKYIGRQELGGLGTVSVCPALSQWVSVCICTMGVWVTWLELIWDGEQFWISPVICLEFKVT
jgi:hypothetical protein